MKRGRTIENPQGEYSHQRLIKTDKMRRIQASLDFALIKGRSAPFGLPKVGFKAEVWGAMNLAFPEVFNKRQKC